MVIRSLVISLLSLYLWIAGVFLIFVRGDMTNGLLCLVLAELNGK